MELKNQACATPNVSLLKWGKGVVAFYESSTPFVSISELGTRIVSNGHSLARSLLFTRLVPFPDFRFFSTRKRKKTKKTRRQRNREKKRAHVPLDCSRQQRSTPDSESVEFFNGTLTCTGKYNAAASRVRGFFFPFCFRKRLTFFFKKIPEPLSDSTHQQSDKQKWHLLPAGDPFFEKWKIKTWQYHQQTDSRCTRRRTDRTPRLKKCCHWKNFNSRYIQWRKQSWL